MIAINFPTPTSVGQTFTFGDRTWQWTGDFWKAVSTTVGYTGSLGYVGSQGIPGSATNPWTPKITDYTASNGDRIIANTIYGSFTITLPSNPTSGYYIQITDGYDLSLYPVTVLRNGSTIEGYADNIILDLKGSTFEFIFVGTTWQVTSTTGPIGPVGYTGSVGPGVITLQQPGALSVYVGTARWYAPYNCTITSVIPRLRVAADQNVNLVLLKNDTPVLTTSINSGAVQGTPYTSGIIAAAGDYFTVNVTQVGSSSVPGTDLYLQVQYSAI
jgi:hypothetical protein